LKKAFTKIGLVEWLKVKALSSSPSTAKKKKKKIKTQKSVAFL
jgi:ribosomal protein S21